MLGPWGRGRIADDRSIKDFNMCDAPNPMCSAFLCLSLMPIFASVAPPFFVGVASASVCARRRRQWWRSEKAIFLAAERGRRQVRVFVQEGFRAGGFCGARNSCSAVPTSVGAKKKG